VLLRGYLMPEYDAKEGTCKLASIDCQKSVAGFSSFLCSSVCVCVFRGPMSVQPGWVMCVHEPFQGCGCRGKG